MAHVCGTGRAAALAALQGLLKAALLVRKGLGFSLP